MWDLFRSSRDDSNTRPSVHYPKTRSGPLGSIKSWIRRSLPSLLIDDTRSPYTTPDSTTSTTASDDEGENLSTTGTQWNEGGMAQLGVDFGSTTRVDYEELFPELSGRNSVYSPNLKANDTSGGSHSTLPSHYHRLPIRERAMTAQSESAVDHRVRHEPSYINLQQITRTYSANAKSHHYASLASIRLNKSISSHQPLSN